MQLEIRIQSPTPPLRRAGAAGLLFLLLLLNLEAASAEINHAFHSDAGQADHECIVTQFSHGQLTAAASEIALPAPVVAAVVVAAVAPTVDLIEIDRQLPAGRAPPLSFA